MWFDEALFDRWIGFPGFVLVVSTTTAAAILCRWFVLGQGRPWLRDLALPALVSALIVLEAPELVVYLAGELLVILAVALLVSRQRQTLGGAKLVVLLLILVVALLYGGTAPSDHALEWCLFGASFGLAVALVELGATSSRLWPIQAAIASCLGILIVGVVGGALGDVDLWSDWYPDTWRLRRSRIFVFGYPAYSVIVYATWRMLMRLAMTPTPPLATTSETMPTGPAAKRVVALRRITVWSALCLLAIFIFTPAIEIYLRMPPVPPPSNKQPLTPNFIEWAAIGADVDPSVIDERTLRFDTDLCVRLAEANRHVVRRAGDLLEQEVIVPIDYRRFSYLAGYPEANTLQLIEAVFIAQFVAGQVESDAQERWSAIRSLMLLAKPFRLSRHPKHLAWGRHCEAMAFYLAYVDRKHLSPAEYQQLLDMIAEPGSWPYPPDEVNETFGNWLLRTRRWRQRVDFAIRTPSRVPAGYIDGETDHDAVRGLLVCELAIEQYRRVHGTIPRELEQLVPEFLPRLPQDPFSEQSLRYVVRDRLRGDYLVYSVWHNGRDDEGQSVWPSPLDDLTLKRYFRDEYESPLEQTMLVGFDFWALQDDVQPAPEEPGTR